MVKSTRSHQDEEEDDEELGTSSQRDGKSSEQKANTPRSKHSATEQRRRSKINERFQILRELIPQNDQKRDKASFLLEVIEYIQFLQEKLQVYEGSYQGWGLEPTKLIPWKNRRESIEGLIDQPHGQKNGSTHENNSSANPAMLTNAQSLVESDLGVAVALDQSPEQATHAVALNILQPPIFSSDERGGMTSLPLPSISNAENVASQPQPQLWQDRPCTTECAFPNNAQEELTSESGTDSISSAYSRGLLNTLTQALQSSGVDLSGASISVQIDVGKRANCGLTTMESGAKDLGNTPPADGGAMILSGVGSFYENSGQAQKRLRTENS